LFISADSAKEKEKREESAAAHWYFKVCRPYSTYSLHSSYYLVFYQMYFTLNFFLLYKHLPSPLFGPL
jgi:hypothetical protein